MKKLFVFAAIALAIMSFGSNIGLVHAQTMTTTSSPAGSVSTATIMQELQVMRATLVNLETKAGMVPQGDTGLPGTTMSPTAGTGAATTSVAPMMTPVTQSTPTVNATLSASDRAALSSSLGALVSALASFNATLAANPKAVASHQAAIAAVLGGMTKTMMAMNTALKSGATSGSASAPIAAATTPTPAPSTGIAVTQPTAQISPNTGTATPAPVAIVNNQPATQPSTGSLAPTAAPAGTTDQPQTAQAANAWGFVVNHWPTITIIILVALILLILFWPSKGDEGAEHGSARPMAKPQASNRPLNASVSQSSQPSGGSAPTPVATVVSSTSDARVTVIRPQQNQQQKRIA